MASAAVGFWSYTRADNEAEGERILRLAARVREEFAALTADELELFVDRDSIPWGQEWKRLIDEALAGTTFFIPIITPRYFRRQECRRELLKFASEARRLGLEQLLLPVYWIPVRELDAEEPPEDEAMALVGSIQWEDLRSVRLLDEDSAEYRQAVNSISKQLAQRVEEVAQLGEEVAADSHVEKRERHGITRESGDDGDEAPGEIELLAEGETALPRFVEAVENLGAEIEKIGTLVEESGQEMEAANRRGAGFASQLTLTERLSRRLEEPASRIGDLGHAYAAELLKVDPAVRTLLDHAADDPEEASEAREFVEGISALAREAEVSLAGLKELLSEMEKASRVSRSLRRPLKRIRAGLQGVLDGQSLIREWSRRAERLSDGASDETDAEDLDSTPEPPTEPEDESEPGDASS